MYRITFSDGENCARSSDLKVDFGFNLLAEDAPEIAQVIADHPNQTICASNACISLPASAGWTATDDNTGTVTFDEAAFDLTFYASPNSPGEGLQEYGLAGWDATMSSENEAIESFDVFSMQAYSANYGFLAFGDPGSNEEPVTPVLSILGQEPLSEPTLGNVSRTLDLGMHSFVNALR